MLNVMLSWLDNRYRQENPSEIRSLPHTEIAAIAKKNLILQRKGKNSYSRVKLNEKGTVLLSMKTSSAWSTAIWGRGALAYLQHLPRSSTRYRDETRHTMTLSCPEVVRRVLFDPDAMLLQEQDELVAGYKTNLIGQRQSVSQTQQVIHLFAGI